jgi:hypothetical protein
MNIHSVIASYEEVLTTSVHLTRKGALICVIEDMWDFVSEVNAGEYPVKDNAGKECFLGSRADLDKMTSDELYTIFVSWLDPIWECSNGMYLIDVVKTQLQG